MLADAVGKVCGGADGCMNAAYSGSPVVQKSRLAMLRQLGGVLHDIQMQMASGLVRQYVEQSTNSLCDMTSLNELRGSVDSLASRTTQLRSLRQSLPFLGSQRLVSLTDGESEHGPQRVRLRLSRDVFVSTTLPPNLDSASPAVTSAPMSTPMPETPVPMLPALTFTSSLISLHPQPDLHMAPSVASVYSDNGQSSNELPATATPLQGSMLQLSPFAFAPTAAQHAASRPSSPQPVTAAAVSPSKSPVGGQQAAFLAALQSAISSVQLSTTQIAAVSLPAAPPLRIGPTCEACSQPISPDNGAAGVRLAGRHWHAACCACSICRRPVDETEGCYFKGSLYCAEDTMFAIGYEVRHPEKKGCLPWMCSLSVCNRKWHAAIADSLLSTYRSGCWPCRACGTAGALHVQVCQVRQCACTRDDRVHMWGDSVRRTTRRRLHCTPRPANVQERLHQGDGTDMWRVWRGNCHGCDQRVNTGWASARASQTHLCACAARSCGCVWPQVPCGMQVVHGTMREAAYGVR